MMQEGMYRNDIHIGDVFEYPIYSGLNITLRVKIVGAYNPKSETNPYWYQGLEGLMNTLQVSGSVFEKGLLKQLKIPLHTSNWYYAFDLQNIKTSQLSPLQKKLDRLISGALPASERHECGDFVRQAAQAVPYAKFAAADATIYTGSSDACDGILFHSHECASIARQAAKRYCRASKPRRRHKANHMDVHRLKACC